LSLIPITYEHILELRRQQFELHEQAETPQYQKLLSDLNASISEWRAWRQHHPGPGTLAVLHAQAQWLVPIFVTVASPALAPPWLFAAIASRKNGGFDLADLYERWSVRITLRSIVKDGGVKRLAHQVS